MTDEIKSAILAVRATAATNMFDINAVSRIALELGFCDLVEYLADRENHREYSEFILYGKCKDE